MTATLSVEVERYFVQSENLKQICDETKSCLAEVDYEHHFDKTLYGAAAWSTQEDANFFGSITSQPRFVVLGASPSAKAAVVNELLGCAVLPTVAAEDVAEKSTPVPVSLEIWRTVLIRYGSSSQYRLMTDSDDSSISKIEESNLLVLSPSLSSLNSAVPASAVRYNPPVSGSQESFASDCLELSIAHPLLKDGTEILMPGYRSNTDDFTAALNRWCTFCVPLVVYVITTQCLTDNDRCDLVALRQSLSEQPVFFIKSRPYVRSDLPESDRYPGLLSASSGGGMFVGSGSMEDSSGSWRDFPVFGNFPTSQLQRDFARRNMSSSMSARPQFVTCFSAPSSDSESPDTSPISSPSSFHSSSVRQQLVDLGFLSNVEFHRIRSSRRHRPSNSGFATPDPTYLSDLIETCHDFPRLIWFVQRVLRSRLISLSSQCNHWHCALLNLFILTAFDMARDQLITPKRLSYAKEKENELYAELIAATLRKQDELQQIFLDVIESKREELLNEAADYAFEESEREDAGFPTCGPNLNLTATARATAHIQQYVVTRVNAALTERLTASLQCLRQTFVGTLSRCLESLEETENGDELSKREGTSASKALKQLLNAAYSVEISVPISGSIVQILLQKMKQVGALLTWVFLLPCYSCAFGARNDERKAESEHLIGPSHSKLYSAASTEPRRQKRACVLTGGGIHSGHSLSISDMAWRRHVASSTLSKLSEIKLAKVLCSQFRERARISHEAFLQALEKLDSVHSVRLARTEQQRLKLRKEHAPKLARLAMESLALRDSLLYGMPKIGPEIGRGQYGVVYACDRWGGHGPCAVKSVVPPDDKHWNDLALEFYYTRSLPDHERIVRLHGAVIDHSYGGGGGQPAVLLIMERMKRDLYSAIRTGLSWPARLRIALDVVDGMRFLHGQGLVHRDIKLKNVLLDENNRGKITDLGFCKPEAMMSGSVVGTPIHMAPELFSGAYDSSVDVYAFGVLFWYICAGHVRLPQAFEQCFSKDQLWHSVRKGLRPEQLANFDNECWMIMRDCWSGDASTRPHLGDIRPRLQLLLDQYLAHNPEYSLQSSYGQPDERMGRRRHWKR